MKPNDSNCNHLGGFQPGRRRLLVAGVGQGVLVIVRPAAATPEELAAAIQAFTSGAQLNRGKVTLEVSQLVDNGNAVPITVRVDSPMSGSDHVTSIAVFNERNPQTDVVKFTLGPRAGKAVVSTRIRLATSQKLTAVARLSDGSFWSRSVDEALASLAGQSKEALVASRLKENTR